MFWIEIFVQKQRISSLIARGAKESDLLKKAPLAQSTSPSAVATASWKSNWLAAIRIRRRPRPARSIRSFPGTDWFVRILGSLDTTPTSRGYGSNRKELLSTLLGRTYPTSEDTEASFKEGSQRGRVHEATTHRDGHVRSPVGRDFIEAATGFSDLEDAVWWFHAHTKDARMAG